MITARLIAIVIGYLAGLFQTGVIYGKITHHDIRKEGSGNTGATNSIRVLGWKAGIIVLAGDLFKCVIPMIIIWAVFRTRFPQGEQLLMLYTGLGAVLGHNFPFYLKFKGGKGIASTVGLICTFCPAMIPVCAAAFFALVVPTGFMSLGSMGMSIAFFIQVIVFGQKGLLRVGTQYLPELYVIAAIITALALIRHKKNIIRLIHGEENKFRPKKKEP